MGPGDPGGGRRGPIAGDQAASGETASHAGDTAGGHPDGATDEPAIAVEVIYGAGPGQIDRSALTLAPGATVADALAASGALARCGLALATAAGEAAEVLRAAPAASTGVTGVTGGTVATVVTVGLWGREVALSTRLRDRDRIELYRPLQVDPKEARRLRYRQQGERGRRRVQRVG